VAKKSRISPSIRNSHQASIIENMSQLLLEIKKCGSIIAAGTLPRHRKPLHGGYMRLAFASIGSLGDLHPMLAIAVAAARRGHEVVVAAAPGYEQNVARAGLEFRPLRPAIPRRPRDVGLLFRHEKGAATPAAGFGLRGCRSNARGPLRSYTGSGFAGGGELLYTAPIAAAREGIPWMNVVLAPTSLLSATDPCVLAPAPWLHKLRGLGPWLHRLAYRIGRLEGRIWTRGYYRFRKSLGLPAGADPIFEAKHSKFGTLVMFPDFLAAPQPDWPRGAVQTGFPFYSQGALDEPVRAFLNQGSPPVVFTLGSIVAHFEPSFYQAAARRRAHSPAARNPAHPVGTPLCLVISRRMCWQSTTPHSTRFSPLSSRDPCRRHRNLRRSAQGRPALGCHSLRF
jgi:hypothetical protein